MKSVNETKVVVGMSGGVDSSVAAAMLKQKGYHVTGITMKTWDGEAAAEEKRHACYGPGEDDDIEDIRKVCSVLDIPLHIIDLTQEYQKEVLEYYSGEYLAGRTPNPCVKCNRTVKFGALLDKTLQSGIEFDYFATGHYAQVEHNTETNRYFLRKAVDLSKDQTYFISALSQAQLSKCLFPLGGMTKAEVRKLAEQFQLPVSDKPESQDFIAGGYRPLIGETKAGEILDTSGSKIGDHKGISNFTIGQRKGLGVTATEPRYVVDIDAERNAVIVGDESLLKKNELYASGLNWVAIESLAQPIEVKARIRYRHREATATVTPAGNDMVYVKFDQPQSSITPGQTVVFYNDDIIIGSGIIERKRSS